MEKTACAQVQIRNTDQNNDAFACRRCCFWDKWGSSEGQKYCAANKRFTWPGNTCDLFTDEV